MLLGYLRYYVITPLFEPCTDPHSSPSLLLVTYLYLYLYLYRDRDRDRACRYIKSLESRAVPLASFVDVTVPASFKGPLGLALQVRALPPLPCRALQWPVPMHTCARGLMKPLPRP